MSNHIDYEINKELGECYLHMGDYDKAEEYYQKAAQSADDIAAPFLGLATIYVQRGDYDAAYAQYSKAAGIEKSDKALAGMGLVQMERKDYDAAYANFKQALEINPENMVAMNCLVQIAHVQGRLSELVTVLENCLKIKESDAVNFTLAGCLVALGRKEEAKKYLQAIMAQNPKHEAAQTLLANIA
ncbi:tetratricopeptide repeat protein [Desulfovibrio litoralis]|uniref:Tetratricopeptide repeat-containing protein n=1 Tax=Desulfovibrio litoralis DSM 11393 TaxID=1121455 RepID=A0A1M7SDB9_9BACT|nr:tetratricopeptide repeat protein [Desulfovibrio litoralis]SHN56507.1 Tetratricopeptide repeat-containing protein [Desulfovibrio litoralis DSM 11393]